MGLAFIAVIVSKQEAKETTEAKVPLMMISAELAGLPVTQAMLEVIPQRILSPSDGL
jgi:hypothetical protein